jgi:hypothetical protein
MESSGIEAQLQLSVRTELVEFELAQEHQAAGMQRITGRR